MRKVGLPFFSDLHWKLSYRGAITTFFETKRLLKLSKFMKVTSYIDQILLTSLYFTVFLTHCSLNTLQALLYYLESRIHSYIKKATKPQCHWGLPLFFESPIFKESPEAKAFPHLFPWLIILFSSLNTISL